MALRFRNCMVFDFNFLFITIQVQEETKERATNKQHTTLSLICKIIINSRGTESSTVIANWMSGDPERKK